MKTHAIILFFLLSVGWAFNAEAYVQSRTQADLLVHWSSGVSLLDIFVNSSNTQSYPSTDVHSQVSASMAQWDGVSRINLRKNSTSGTNQENLNEIFFSIDPNFFGGGTGVVGLTQVYFKNNSGEIIEADILLNDNYSFSDDITDIGYLGNVVSHELGHFLGLGHSQVVGASMFYALTRGQSQLASDDKAGVYSLYPRGDSTKSSLKGKIVGGNSLAAVFGAQVQAISLKTGQVAGASISEIDGSFSIDGLDKNEQYYIYTNPISAVGLPARFDNARSDFCNSSKKYRGSFFQACGSSQEGFPQSIKLTSSEVNVGNITIRCALDVPVDYIQNKSTTPAVFDTQNFVSSGVGNAFVGYFSGQEIATGAVIDYFKMDYSNVDWSALDSSSDLYVELKIMNQAFNSPFKAKVSIKRDSSTTAVTPFYVQGTDGWLNIETFVRIPINRAVSSDNDFEISVTPEIMQFPSFPSGLPLTKADYFPASAYFEDSVYFYLVSASIVKDNGDSTYSLVSYKNHQVSDNTTCPDAANTYALTNYSATGKASSSKKKKGAFACGTVDFQNGPGGGPGGFFIGLFLSLLLGSLTTSIIKQIRLKHYSKIA